MSDEQTTGRDNRRTDVVSGFDQTNRLTDGIDSDDWDALDPAERDSVFEDSWRMDDEERRS